MATEKPTTTPVLPSTIEVTAPKSAEEFANVLLEGCVRAIKCAMNSKEMTDAVKAGESLYKTLYGDDGDDDLGSALAGQGRSNGHGA